MNIEEIKKQILNECEVRYRQEDNSIRELLTLALNEYDLALQQSSKVPESKKPLTVNVSLDAITQELHDELYGITECGKDCSDLKIIKDILTKYLLPNQPEESKTEWISVEERLPEINTDAAEQVLAVSSNEKSTIVVCTAFYLGKFYDLEDWRYKQLKSPVLKFVTHWMPLPQSPETKTII